ncbi:unnamed protein product [Mytilus coruscus]|uniref:RNase H type-1 domain-containing protein n=1 Tax=Mytilus coruscus TaxID=42192 RepID=A0A6J8E0M6_MYTCO|nr:unnamed protein product [Mytilus coruscus]
MSESSPRLELNEDILFEGDTSIPQPNIHKAADKSSDLVDTVELIKTILDSKLDKIKSRNKKIRIADSSPAGWGTVKEYEANAVASDSEDERKIRQAETRTIRTSKEKSKSRQQPFPKNPPRQQPAESYGNPAYAQHYQRTQSSSFVGASQGVSLAHSTCATTASSKATGEKTVLFSPASGHATATPQPTRSSTVEPELHSSVIVNDKYLDTINDQFSICFLDNDHIESFLEQVQYFENCQSYDKFKGVKGRLASHVKYWENIGACPFVLDTIKNGYVIPFIDTPFNMYHKNNRSARQNTEFVTKSIEDLVQIGCIIKVPFQPYVVNQLSVATQKSDDGFGVSPDENTCYEQSSFVKWSLIDAGFLINEEKSVFKPVTELECLGKVWNSKEYKSSITQRRVDDLISSLNVIFAKFPFVTARSLAQVVGRIISMTPVIENVARIMSKFCYMEIESRIGWDIHITGYKPVEVLSELKFWLENVTMINYRKLSHYSKSSAVIYSDASNIAAGAYTVELENKIFHKMWTCSETVQNSTWRELKAIELALFSFKDSFTGKTIKWFTDNQNCVKIVNSGSMKENLHIIAKSIFSFCIQKGISIDIQWIPRKENEKADYISKMVDFEDWGVTHIFFIFLNDMWGPYSVDRFASVENRKVLRFNSLFWQPDSEAVDAFSQV